MMCTRTWSWLRCKCIMLQVALVSPAAACSLWPLHRHVRVLSSRCIHIAIPAMEEVSVKVPSMGDSITTGTVGSVTKAEGDVVKTDDVIAMIETDKVSIDVRYTGSQIGILKSLQISEGQEVEVDQVVGVVDDDVSAVAAAGGDRTEVASQAGQESTSTSARPSESLPADAAVPRAIPSPAPANGTGGPPTQAPIAPSEREERRVKMSRLRLRVADRLKDAQNTYAMLTTFNEIDMTNIMAMRSKYKDAFLEAHGVKLGFMSAFAKAASSALEMVPAVNAVIDNNETVYRDYVDISIAVATPKGLVVPVLRNVDQMRFADVEKEIVTLGKKARDGSLGIDDMAGGTFTISNGGVYGSLLSTPIINPPQSAILGMHSIQQRPMVIDGSITSRPMMYVALSYDHRLIDGREAVTFLRRIKDVIEDPRRLLLDV
eukprot:jgi/Ulvmu1/7362/UM036_0022.1